MSIEETKGSDEIINPIKNTLRLKEKNNDLIIEAITKSLTPARDIIFLTGIGKAWPIIRTHTILSKLHHRIEKNPLVMFFPGSYINEPRFELRLFDEFGDNNYYKAFRLIER
jgi:hypothetical protein